MPGRIETSNACYSLMVMMDSIRSSVTRAVTSAKEMATCAVEVVIVVSTVAVAVTAAKAVDVVEVVVGCPLAPDETKSPRPTFQRS